jgi:hypothetical protein
LTLFRLQPKLKQIKVRQLYQHVSYFTEAQEKQLREEKERHERETLEKGTFSYLEDI